MVADLAGRRPARARSRSPGMLVGLAARRRGRLRAGRAGSSGRRRRRRDARGRRSWRWPPPSCRSSSCSTQWRGQQRPADTDLTRTLLSQPLAAVVLQLTMALSLAAASVGLTGRGIRAEDAFARRLGLAVLFFAFSMLHYALLPPVDPRVGAPRRRAAAAVLRGAAVGGRARGRRRGGRAGRRARAPADRPRPARRRRAGARLHPPARRAARRPARRRGDRGRRRAGAARTRAGRSSTWRARPTSRSSACSPATPRRSRRAPAWP